MALAYHLSSFQGLTLVGVVESYAALRLDLFPKDTLDRVKMVAGILFANYTFALIFWLGLYPRFFHPLRHIRGPKEIFSAATRYLVDKEGPGELFIDIAKQYPDEDLISLDVLGKQFLVNDPALLADLLVHNCYDFSKPRRTHRYMRYIVGDGLIVVEEDEHKFLRKNTMPAFRFRHIKELYPMMWAKSVILATKLREEMGSSGPDGSSVVEISSWASKVTLDIIGVAALGRDLDSVKKGDDPLQQLYESVTDISMKKVIFTIMGLALGFKTLSFFPWKLSTQFFSESISLHSICRDMVKEKTEAIAKKEDDHFDILSLLIKANNMDDEALKDSLLNFLGAG